ncbi:conserved hypothetical protein [Aspergillus terreus NIH2624]|uniref:Amino acid transporter transmembrane domain-containing protein n=1 Tax=Aspergillus terreus (strain NIH 2624 / FGSC A1156) TaxID=341663 RepID=Q0CDD3_ASPTN|nr:uncharacterized protein ATEG_08301 [Aspergillus terreus NIH2624]EAU31474.1 conserved hypothetical protein [Aspergillus terreus NIH2624]
MSPQIVDLDSSTIHVDTDHGSLHHGVGQEPVGADEKKGEITSPSRQDAFGDEEFAEVKYKVLKWWQGGLLMVAETISLGILSLPAAVAHLGLVPAIIILLSMGMLASYTGYVIGQFKWRYPHISSMADAGEVLMGPFGRELLGCGQLLFLIFLMGSHVLTFSVAMNVLTDHATCSIAFGILGMFISFIMSLPRTLEKMSWLSLISFASIFFAVLIVMVALGIQNPRVIVEPTVQTSLVTAFTSASNIILSFGKIIDGNMYSVLITTASHNTFFTFIAELRDPKDFKKSLAVLQAIDISLYLTASVVIYCYAGKDIIIAGVINGHVASKAIYLRIFAGTDRMHKRDLVAVSSWIAIALVLWVIAWIIATAIPVFSTLLSLITALFASWFTFGFPGMFWLFMNKGLWFSSPRKVFLTLLNTASIGIGMVLCGLGLYASGKTIHDDSSSQSFSCANNA